MNFATNYDDLGSSEMLPEGKYECIIKSAEEKALGGYPVLDIRCVIRNDVEQKCKDRFIFHKIWKKKEPSPQDQQVDGYSFKQLMNLAAAAKIPAGKNYQTVAELCADFNGKCVRAEIIHEENKKDGKKYERVKFFEQTGFPECRHVFKASAAQSTAPYKPAQNDPFAQPAAMKPAAAPDLSDFVEIDTGDLPF